MAKPIGEFKCGGVKCAIWQNEKGNSFSFQKSYKDKNGEWQNTNFFSVWDLGNLISCVIQAIGSQKAQTKQSESDDFDF